MTLRLPQSILQNKLQMVYRAKFEEQIYNFNERYDSLSVFVKRITVQTDIFYYSGITAVGLFMALDMMNGSRRSQVLPLLRWQQLFLSTVIYILTLSVWTAALWPILRPAMHCHPFADIRFYQRILNRDLAGVTQAG